MKSGRKRERQGIPEIEIVTTNPYGPGVTRYLEVLERRVEGLGSSNPGVDVDEEFDISVLKKTPEEIFRLYNKAGLRHGIGGSEEDFVEKHGRDSDYALIVNNLMNELVLYVNGESHPLKPVAALSRSRGTEVLFE